MKIVFQIVKWLLALWLLLMVNRIVYCWWLAGQDIPEAPYWKQRLVVNAVWFVAVAGVDVFLFWYMRKRWRE